MTDMGRGLRFIEARLLPRGWMDLIRQIVLFVGALLVYDLVRGSFEDGNPYRPFGDAMRIIDIERTLHVFIEPSVQAWALNKHWLIDGADWVYVNGHFFVTFAVLAFIYARRNDSFYFVRNMFMIAMALALIGYWLYPTAPPRLMPEWGFTDAISQFVTGGTELDRHRTDEGIRELLRRCPLDARLLRGDDRRIDVPADPLAPGQDHVGAVPLGDHVRGRRHRQPLPHRRVPRRPHRRRIRAAGTEVASAGKAGCVGIPLVPGRPPTVAGHPVDRVTMPEQTQRPRGRQETVRRAAAAAAERPTAQETMRNRLIESRLTPNAISLTGFALNLAAAGLIVGRMFFLAGIAFIVGSIMDTLDGRYSRMSGKGTPFGAFLDSTLDRLEEGIVLIAVGAYFASKNNQVAAAATVAAVLGSLMVSYTRARAEALGVECKVGLATRPVRVVILSIGLVFAKGASLGHFELLAPAVYVLAGLTVLTVLQRILHVRKQLKSLRPPDRSARVTNPPRRNNYRWPAQRSNRAVPKEKKEEPQ